MPDVVGASCNDAMAMYVVPPGELSMHVGGWKDGV